MASCAALNCTFLDHVLADTTYGLSPPLIVADPDIAGLGVFALFLLHLCKSLNLLSGHSRILLIGLCYLDRGCYWVRLRIRR